MRALQVAGLLVLAGCPTLELGETPADIGTCKPSREYYETTIWPELIERPDNTARSCVNADCHAHAPGGSGGSLHFETDPVDHDVNYRRATGFRLNCGSPEESQLIKKPLGDLDHEVLFTAADAEVATFLAWFDQ